MIRARDSNEEPGEESSVSFRSAASHSSYTQRTSLAFLKVHPDSFG